MMLDLHGPGYITEVVLIVVCVCCVLCVVCCVFSDIAHSTHAHNIIHLMMIIHGIQHGGLYFRWCSLLPKKDRKMRRRRARSPFSLLTPPQISENLWIEKFPYLYGERFF